MAGQIKAVRGMKDILPPETSRWQWVEQVAREVFELYGYYEIRLPLLERKELFTRSIGMDTDIVAKEMYTLEDRHGDVLALRPEATAQVVRAYLESGLHRSSRVNKFYLVGPMFRYERPQKGRFRQFHQINCEALGSNAPELDAEVILMLLDILRKSGLLDLHLLINSLGCPACTPIFKARLQQYLATHEGWCEDCQRRRITNPLRVLDCKSKTCQELLANAPIMEDSLCEACATHYNRVLSLLTGAKVLYLKNPRLVRGLDYYTRTAFEVKAEGLGAQDAVAGGGRYNRLSQELGGPDLPALGFAIGEDRLLEVLPQEVGPTARRTVFLAALGDAARERAFMLLQEIRGQGLPAAMDFEGRSLKAQMSLADRLGAAYVVILGDQELETGEAPLRRMASGEQEILPLTDLAPMLALLTRKKEGN